MFEYLLFKIKRALLQFLCNFIPILKWRVRARGAVFARFLVKEFIGVNEVDSRLPREILPLINAHSNAEFIALNRTLSLPNTDIIANERERRGKA